MVNLWSHVEAPGDRRVTWMELFFDLVFVAAVAQVGAPLVMDYSFQGLGRYTFLLLVIWWAWNGHAVYSTRFDPDDRLQRALTMMQMIAVIFMAANAEQGLDSVSSAGFAAAYAVMRVILVLQYLRASALPSVHRLTRLHARGIGMAACVWLVSACVPTPARYALWVIAFAIDVATVARASRYLEAFPPHAAHLPERYGLFTLILLGESIVAIMKGIQAQPDWTVPAAASAFLGLGAIFVVWWSYFESARATAHRRIRSRRDVRAFEIWSHAHVLLYLGLVLAAVGVEHIIRTGATTPLHTEEALVLATAVASVLIALVVIARTSRSTRAVMDLHVDPAEPCPLTTSGTRTRSSTASTSRSTRMRTATASVISKG
jgi:low temperature requirement protein LtrA